MVVGRELGGRARREGKARRKEPDARENAGGKTKPVISRRHTRTRLGTWASGGDLGGRKGGWQEDENSGRHIDEVIKNAKTKSKKEHIMGEISITRGGLESEREGGAEMPKLNRRKGTVSVRMRDGGGEWKRDNLRELNKGSKTRSKWASESRGGGGRTVSATTKIYKQKGNATGRGKKGKIFTSWN